MKFLISTVARARLAIICGALFCFGNAWSQNTSIAMGDLTVKQNAVLYLNSVNKDQGFIIPVVTSRNSITGGPERGMIVFDDGDDKIYYYDGTTWIAAGDSNGGTSGLHLEITGNDLQLLNGSTVLSSISLADGTGLDSTAGQLIMWDGSKWIYTSATSPPTDGQALTWDTATQTWKARTVSGSGDMLRSTYDSNNDNVVDVADAVNYMPQASNAVLASPDGNSGTPSFRALTSGDVPELDASKISTGSLSVARGGTNLEAIPANGELLIGDGSGYNLATLTAGNGINITNGAGSVTISSSSLANPMTTAGDVIVGGSSGLPSRLPVGTDGQVLAVNSGEPSWLTLGSLSMQDEVSGGASGDIVDASITDADIASNAAISGLKVSPDFGAQDMVTTGTLSSGPLSASNLAAINSVPYDWPGTQGNANTVLTNDGSGALTWSPSTGLSAALSSGKIFVGNTANVATAVAVSGDAMIDHSGVLTLTSEAVTSQKILDGSIDDADISSAAAIAGTKISPDFGDQAITTTGSLSSGAISTPNLASINDVAYSWPNTQGVANTVLTNNGSGGLSWSSPASSATLPSGSILIGNAANVATAVVVNGDASLDAAGTLALSDGAVNSAKILDGAIDNVDVSSTAAIAGTKITPDFGSQAITTTGTLSSGSITAANLASIKDVAYSWPELQGAVNTVLTNDGNGNLTWSPSAGLGATLPSGSIFVGNASNVAAGVVISGDASLSSTGELTISDDAITSEKISDGTVTDDDISPSASIAGTKVSPAFGSQNISTTGTLSVLGSTTFNGMTYAWPSGNAGANTVLTNNGAGVLSWETSGAGGSSSSAVTVIAGEAITAGDVVYFNLQNGNAYVASSSDHDKTRANGIATETKGAGQSILVLVSGNYSTTGLSPSAAYFLGSNGAVATAPSGVRIGTATSATNLLINILQDDRDAIGTIKPYLKNLTNIPASNLSAFWAECNGQLLADTESLLNGTTLPNLNGNYFLRGSSASGGTGGSETHFHNMITTGSPPSGKIIGGNTANDYYRTYTDTQFHLPPYYDVVYIVKIK